MGRRKTGSQRAYERLEKDGDKWALILYSALALTMCRNWNMKKTAVTRLVNTTWDAWKECAQTNEKSMIMMCEEETGIEIRNGDGKGWRDVAYLNGEDLGPMTDAQWLYMRQQQIKWVRPNIMACILIGLHRKYGFGFDRCARVYAQIEEIEQEFKSDPKRIRRAAQEEVGVDIYEMLHCQRKSDVESV